MIVNMFMYILTDSVPLLPLYVLQNQLSNRLLCWITDDRPEETHFAIINNNFIEVCPNWVFRLAVYVHTATLWLSVLTKIESFQMTK